MQPSRFHDAQIAIPADLSTISASLTEQLSTEHSFRLQAIIAEVISTKWAPHYKMRFITLSIIQIMMITSVRSATYYVGINGSDSGTGSVADPFRTIERGTRIAKPGDTIIVRDGVYGPGSRKASSMPVNIYNSGNSAAWIVLKAEHKWGAVLDCQLKCHSYISFANGSGYWILQDFDITGGLSAGVWANSSTHHIVIKGNHFHNIGHINTKTPYGIAGFYSGPAARNIRIDGNVFDDIGRINIDIPNHDHGLYLEGSQNATVTKNIFWNIFRGWAIQLSHGASNVLIGNNTFAFANPYRNGQIALWAGTSGVTIRNNIFYSTKSVAVEDAGGKNSDCVVDNNIIYGARSVTNVQDCLSTSNRFVNPQFVNASSAPYNFHLKANSPAIGAGIPIHGLRTDGTRRPQGEPSDIGAYEFNKH
jgi:hypothetical protein